MSRRVLLAGGGVAVAAAAGGWFVFLRGSDTQSPDTPGTSFQDAPEVSDGRHGPYEITAEEAHFFAVELSQSDELTATIEFSHSEGDLDIALYDPTESLQTTGATTSDNETVSLTAAADGTHYINPYGFAGATNSYELVVEIN